MLVLGITDGISCGAAIVEDGRILAAVNEESIVRIKMAYGFPRKSIARVMGLVGVSPGEIDLVAAATNNNHFFDGIREWDGWFTQSRGAVRDSVFKLASELSSLAVLPGVEQLYYAARSPAFAQRREAIRRILAEEFQIEAKVEFVNHHLAHCTSAYFTSGFGESLVVSMDGGGDGASSHVYHVRDGRFRRVGFTSAFNSLGNYYSYVTELCGFKAQKHEGKITGLAAHGKPVYMDVLRSLIDVKDGEIVNVGRAAFASAMRKLADRLPEDWTRENLAASIQRHSENVARAYVEAHLEANPSRNLALAGGLFANVRINQNLAEIDGVSEVFVHPGMSDAGLAVGSALATGMANRKAQRMPSVKAVIRDVYLGPEYSPDEIRQALLSEGLEVEKSTCIEKDIGSLLAQGYVVARFNGRMEYGPRALGNRSILYHPADLSVNDWLNKLLKRTEFMPFAPSTLIEYADDYYLNVDSARESARFMTITFGCTDLARTYCAGTVHIDGTARPQLVREEDNPSYYRIIDEFRRITGIATVINTSFNMHEEPIVCSPEDALRAFLQGHLDYLAIGDFLVPSPEPIKHRLRPMPKFEELVADATP
jgi:carbamoyltransferase